MNILLVNDDGIDVKGLWVAASALAKAEPKNNLYVFAPDRQRTACGHGITMRGPITLSRYNGQGSEYVEEAWACSGTPADCVKLGIYFLQERGIEIDAVCSGINHGANLGVDAYYSGTVAAAREGSLHGIPSAAFSAYSHEPEHFEAFESLIPSIVLDSLFKLPPESFVSVNVPELPLSEIKGIEVTDMGRHGYDDVYEEISSTEDAKSFDLVGGGFPEEDEEPTTDTGACHMGYITVTPMRIFNECPSLIEDVKGWDMNFGR